jgi:DNA-binding CsgD family transcriptional regulator
MTSIEKRLAPWLGFVGDLLGGPLEQLPHEAVFDQLLAAFPALGVSFNWSNSDGRLGVITRPSGILDQYEETFAAWQRGEISLQHPLITWYVTTGDIRPNTCARVPTRLVPGSDRAAIMKVLHEINVEQQLAITYRLRGGLYQAYVVCRGGSDFTDDDLVVARQIQRALMGLDRQITLVSQLTKRTGLRQVDVGLTDREFAVLGLVASGSSTRLIAHRLQCSPRTVNKHLEHIYRKLGVGDRVNAVLAASLWGLGATRPASAPKPSHRAP